MKNLNNTIVKIVLILIIQLFSCALLGQSKIAIFSDPNATLNDGFNIGVSAEHQMEKMYFKFQVFSFPDLNDVSYTEISGTPLGFNLISNNNFRVYTGVKIGFVYRDGVHPLAGLEGGIDFNITDSFFIGIVSTYETREDLKIYGKHADTSARFSGFVRFGARF